MPGIREQAGLTVFSNSFISLGLNLLTYEVGVAYIDNANFSSLLF